MDKIGYTDYNYRPHKERDIAKQVHVSAGIKTLEYAINLKEKGIVANENVALYSGQ